MCGGAFRLVQRGGQGVVGQFGQQVRDIFAAEEPPCVLALEPGQAPVRSVGAGGPPAGRPLGPLQGTGPPGQHDGIGLAARAQDPEQSRLEQTGAVITRSDCSGAADTSGVSSSMTTTRRRRRCVI